MCSFNLNNSETIGVMCSGRDRLLWLVHISGPDNRTKNSLTVQGKEEKRQLMALKTNG